MSALERSKLRDGVRPASFPPLRGRDDALQCATGILESTERTGQAALIAIEGEPGIGKTALIASAVDKARALGFKAVSAKTEEAEIAPLAPIVQSLRAGANPLLGRAEFAELATLMQQPLFLIERLTEFVESRAVNCPVLIAIDDVQWLDDLSAYAMRAMPGRLAGFPIVWVVSSRVESGSRFDDIVVSAARELTTLRLKLEPLSPIAVEQIAADWLQRIPDARTKAMLEGANGNPFLIVELLTGLTSEPYALDELPRSLLHAVQRRLASLPLNALRLLEAGSVIGVPFTIEDAAALAHIAEDLALDAVDGAVRSGVLVDRGAMLSFKHDLLRAGVYHNLPATRRKAMHRSAAGRLLQSAGPVAAASHLVISAIPHDKAAVEILRAAAEQLATTAPTVSSEFILKAFELVDRTDALWLEIGEKALDILAAGNRSRATVSLAAELLSANPTNECAARIQLLVIGQLRSMGRYAEITARIDSIDFNYVTPGVRSLLIAYRAISLTRDPDPARAIAAGTYSLQESRRIEEREAEALSLFALLETARNQGRNAESLRYAEEIRRVTGRISVDEIIALQLVDRFDDSERLWSQALQEMEGDATHARAFELGFSEVTRKYFAGSLDEAQAAALAVLRLGDELQEQRMQYETHIFLSAIAMMRDDASGASFHVGAAAAGMTDDDLNREASVHLARAIIATHSEDFRSALAHFRNIYGEHEIVRHRWRWQPQFLLAAARAGYYGGDIQFARRIAEQAKTLASHNPDVPTITGVAAHIRGLVYDDDSSLEEAETILRSSPRDLNRGDIARERGRIFVARGRRTDGIACLQDARHRFARIGAFSLVRAVERDLQAAGVRRRDSVRNAKRPTEGWESLTKAEVRVAKLIADGRSNREAAAELVVTPNTLRTHMRSIFDKLRVASRVQLTRVVLDNEER
jgi:DNA-binding CsgD family transcriptional regulator